MKDHIEGMLRYLITAATSPRAVAAVAGTTSTSSVACSRIITVNHGTRLVDLPINRENLLI